MTLLYRPDMMPYEIYGITYNVIGDPQFLIYRKGHWRRIDAEYFTPNYICDGSGRYEEYEPDE